MDGPVGTTPPLQGRVHPTLFQEVYPPSTEDELLCVGEEHLEEVAETCPLAKLIGG